MSDKRELDRRRLLLFHAIGDHLQLKREALKPKHVLHGRSGELLDVRRTKATIDFADAGKWNVPIVEVLLPGSIEPDPRQRDLFVDEGVTQ